MIKTEKIDFAAVILNKLKEMDTPKKGVSEKELEKATKPGYRSCDLCQKEIKIPYYKKHLYQTHNGARKDKEVECVLCNIQFSRRERLKGHFKSVHKDDMHLLCNNFTAKFDKNDCNFICKECKIAFITKSSLNYHESRKHGKGTFICSKCNRRCVSKWSLEKHQNQCKATS